MNKVGGRCSEGAPGWIEDVEEVWGWRSPVVILLVMKWWMVTMVLMVARERDELVCRHKHKDRKTLESGPPKSHTQSKSLKLIS